MAKRKIIRPSLRPPGEQLPPEIQTAGQLNDQQKRFCEEYIIDLNAPAAYGRAGYSASTATANSYKLLARPHIQEEIQKCLKRRSRRTNVTADFVLTSLVEVAKRCMQKVPVMEFDYEAKEMVQKQAQDEEGNWQGVWEFDSAGANRSLELLAKHLGLFEKDNKQKPVSIYDVTLVLNNTEKPHAIGSGNHMDQRQIGQGE